MQPLAIVWADAAPKGSAAWVIGGVFAVAVLATAIGTVFGLRRIGKHRPAWWRWPAMIFLGIFLGGAAIVLVQLGQLAATELNAPVRTSRRDRADAASGSADGISRDKAPVAEADASANAPPDGSVVAGPGADRALAVFSEIIDRYCAADFTEADALLRFAPHGLVEAGGVTLPGGQAFVIRNDVVVSLNVGNGPTSPYAQVVWWMQPTRPDDPLAELHVVPDARGRVLPYRDFVAARRLGAPSSTVQGGSPLADLLHRHLIECGGGRTIELTVHEIVWAEPFVGKVGELELRTHSAATHGGSDASDAADGS